MNLVWRLPKIVPPSLLSLHPGLEFACWNIFIWYLFCMRGGTQSSHLVISVLPLGLTLALLWAEVEGEEEVETPATPPWAPPPKADPWPVPPVAPPWPATRLTPCSTLTSGGRGEATKGSRLGMVWISYFVSSALERLYSIYTEFYLLALTSPPQRGLGEPQGSLVEPLAEGVSMNIFCFILYVEYNAAIESRSGHLIGICAD